MKPSNSPTNTGYRLMVATDSSIGLHQLIRVFSNPGVSLKAGEVENFFLVT
jgi:hypothetical protein